MTLYWNRQSDWKWPIQWEPDCTRNVRWAAAPDLLLYRTGYGDTYILFHDLQIAESARRKK